MLSRKNRSSRKLPAATACVEPPVGRGDDPHVHLGRLLGAEPLQHAGLEGAEQLGLGLEVEVAHLVEEQGALVRQLEAAQPALGGAGEGAALVAEHLGLDQLARNRRAVHRDERLRAPAGWRGGWRRPPAPCRSPIPR